MFVGSFAVDGKVRPSPLIRIGVIALGPMVWNAAVLLVLFFISVFLGPGLSSLCVKFGAVMASIAHVLAVVGLVGFFEFLVSDIESPLVSLILIFSSSGSSNAGTPHMPFWVSLRLWRSNGRLTRSSYRYS